MIGSLFGGGYSLCHLTSLIKPVLERKQSSIVERRCTRNLESEKPWFRAVIISFLTVVSYFKPESQFPYL